ncbi:MAG: EF-hand domain-containing protein [Pseudomonadota bacterium]
MRPQARTSKNLAAMTLFVTMLALHTEISATANPDADDQSGSDSSKPEEQRRELFRLLDRDSDGVLIGEELRSSPAANGMRMRLIDQNADGQITLEEFQAYDAMEGNSRRKARDLLPSSVET